MISEDMPGELRLPIPKEVFFSSSFQSTKDEKNLDIDTLINDLHSQFRYSKRCSVNFPLEMVEPKSAAKATECRNLGNRKFKTAKDHEALKLYTESVAFAEEGSEELALAYANRSAALFRIREYVSCLLDVNRALEGRYPEKLKQKLHERKKSCLAEIEKASEDQEQLRSIRGDETDPGIKEKNPKEEAEWRKLCNFQNSLLPNASSKIKIECDEKWGRFIVAVEDIEAGEILSSQKFFVRRLEPSETYLHCSYCFSKCRALIPCPSCHQVMYCSKHCRSEAYNSYHRIECKLMSFRKVNRSSGFQLMAIRMLLIGTKQGDELENIMKKLSIRNIFDEKMDPRNKKFSTDYFSSLNLCRTYKPSWVKCFAFSAVETITVLQRVGYFGNNNSKVQLEYVSETELYATMLLINHIIALKSNRFSIERLSTPNLLMHPSACSIGTGVCIFNNLLNHSCYPSAHFFVRNEEQVSFAMRPIPKGEQIFTSYFSSFATIHIDERIETSAKFDFICECEACTNKWPLDEDLLLRRIEYLTDNKAKALENLVEIIFPIVDAGRTGLSNDEILRAILDCRKWLHFNVKPPCTDIVQCENLVSHFLKLLYDDFFREYMTEVRNMKLIESILRAIMNHVSVMS